MKKRCFSLLLAALLLLSLLPAAALPAQAEAPALPDETISPPVRDSRGVVSGTCGANGGNLTWQLDLGTGEMVISGSGKMMSGGEGGDACSTGMPWASYWQSINFLTVEEGVTSIGNYAFQRCDYLSEVKLPDSLQSIGISAFEYCQDLPAVVIPENVQYIDFCAFNWCSYLSSLVISEGVKEVGPSAFSYCTALTSVTLPASLTYLGADAFARCSKLTSVTFSEGITARLQCAFSYTPVPSLSIPASMTDIDCDAFNDCKSLESISVHPDNPVYWAGEDGILYTTRNGADVLVRCPPGKQGLGSYAISSDVAALAEYAFAGCRSLTAVIVPEGVTALPYGAFQACANLASVTLPDSMAALDIYTFASCKSLTELALPSGLSTIAPFAFEQCGLRSIRLPAGLSKIEQYAFSQCANLTEVFLPASVQEIGECAFWHCPIEDLYFGGSSAAWAAFGLEDYDVSARFLHFGVTDPENHWIGQVSKAPTCTTLGYQDLHCPCGFTQTQLTMPALGHDFVEGVCTRCGQINYEADGTELPFGDVPEAAYYAEAVAWALNNGIAAGTSADSFSPDEACSRAQLMTFLWRAEGCPEPVSQDCPFTDVPADAYYTKAVLWAVEQGITSGTSDTTFSPKQVCTRAQTVTFLWRAEGSPAPASGGLPFTDLVSGAYYYKAVKWAAQQGIVSGVSETSFAPNRACTRGQAVTILYRYYHLE